jgi:hypothetical protein
MAASGPEDEAGRFECRLVVAWNRSGDPVAGTSERQLGKLEDRVVRTGKRAIGREAGNGSVSHIADDELAQPGELVGAGQVAIEALTGQKCRQTHRDLPR